MRVGQLVQGRQLGQFCFIILHPAYIECVSWNQSVLVEIEKIEKQFIQHLFKFDKVSRHLPTENHDMAAKLF